MYTKQEVEYWFRRLAGEPSDQAAKFKRLHDAAREFALIAQELLPARHESIRAMDAIQEAVLWGNSAIARDGSATGLPATQRPGKCDHGVDLDQRCGTCIGAAAR